jgi:hypothetical protein
MDLVSLGRKNPILYNVLGLEVLLLRIKHQVDRYKAVDKRIFQLSDPYICISVVGKGRSGSRQLNRVLKRIGAYLLAFGLHVVVAHVDSLDSPSGKGSRVW